MDDLIKLVKSFRLMVNDDLERVRLADLIFDQIESDIRLFVFSAIQVNVAEDVCQEVLKGVAVGLPNFKGQSKEQFWGWAYQISRNKINDHLRKKASDKLEPLDSEQLLNLVDETQKAASISAADRVDLQDAIQMLTKAKPECREYLWNHFVIGFSFNEIAESEGVSNDSIRMRTSRCLELAQSLLR